MINIILIDEKNLSHRRRKYITSKDKSSTQQVCACVAATHLGGTKAAQK